MKNLVSVKFFFSLCREDIETNINHWQRQVKISYNVRLTSVWEHYIIHLKWVTYLTRFKWLTTTGYKIAREITLHLSKKSVESCTKNILKSFYKFRYSFQRISISLKNYHDGRF